MWLVDLLQGVSINRTLPGEEGEKGQEGEEGGNETPGVW